VNNVIFRLWYPPFRQYRHPWSLKIMIFRQLHSQFFRYYIASVGKFRLPKTPANKIIYPRLQEKSSNESRTTSGLVQVCSRQVSRIL
jgi:hypothetical protein